MGMAEGRTEFPACQQAVAGDVRFGLWAADVALSWGLPAVRVMDEQRARLGLGAAGRESAPLRSLVFCSLHN